MPMYATLWKAVRLGWCALVLGAVLLAAPAFGQTLPVKQWDTTLGGTGDDQLYILRPTPDGGYIMGGVTTSGVSGDKTEPSRGLRDYWVVKIDAQGTKQWDKTFGGSSYDEMYDVVPTRDGGYLLGGSSASGISGDKSEPNKGYSDYWVIKIDSLGTKQWDRTLGGLDSDYLFNMCETADGGFLLGGNSYSGIGGDKTQPSRGGVDCWVVKINALGQKRWDKTYGGSADDFNNRKSLALTRDGGFLVGCFSNSGVSGDKTQPCWGGGDGDYWVLKLDSLGTRQWDRTVGGTLSERLTAIFQTTDGGYLLAGSSASGVSGNKTEPNHSPLNPTGYTAFDFWVVKLDAAGVQQWDRTYGTADAEYLNDAQQTADGGYILAGSAPSSTGGDKTAPGRGLEDGWLVKLGPNGLKQWDADFGASGPEFFTDVHETADGGFALGSASNSPVSGDKSQPNRGQADYWVIKVGAPAVRITGDTRVCAGGQVVLSAASATSGATFTWSTGATSPAISVAQAGTYTVTATFPSGLTSTARHTVQAFTPPAPLITGDTLLCAGQALTLTAAAGGQPTYRWNTGATTPSISVTQPGTYTLTASYGSGCVVFSRRTVVQPVLRIDGTPLLCPGQGGRTTLLALATGGLPRYRWNTGATTAALPVAQPGTYTVVATFANGCTLTATQTVSAPTVNIAGDSLLCVGRTAALRAVGTSATAYQWSTGATGSSITVAQAGSYALTATFATGCTATTTFRVRAVPAVPAFTLGPDTTVCEGTALVLSAPTLANGRASYRWSDGSTGASLRVQAAGTYSLMVNTPCETRSVSRRVDYRSCVAIPTIVTANGDNLNDYFAPQGLQGAWMLSVFDRWGRLVYQDPAYANNWGISAAPGVYYFLLRQPSTGGQYKGTVEVIR
jgi:hypothetical protein